MRAGTVLGGIPAELTVVGGIIGAQRHGKLLAVQRRRQVYFRASRIRGLGSIAAGDGGRKLRAVAVEGELVGNGRIGRRSDGIIRAGCGRIVRFVQFGGRFRLFGNRSFDGRCGGRYGINNRVVHRFGHRQNRRGDGKQHRQKNGGYVSPERELHIFSLLLFLRRAAGTFVPEKPQFNRIISLRFHGVCHG